MNITCQGSKQNTYFEQQNMQQESQMALLVQKVAEQEQQIKDRDAAIEFLTDKNKEYEQKFDQMDVHMHKLETLLLKLQQAEQIPPYKHYRALKNPVFGNITNRSEGGERFGKYAKYAQSKADTTGNELKKYRRERIMSSNSVQAVLRIQNIYGK